MATIDANILNSASVVHGTGNHAGRLIVGSNAGIDQIQVANRTAQMSEQARLLMMNRMVLAVIMAGKNGRAVAVERSAIKIYGLDVVGIRREIVL